MSLRDLFLYPHYYSCRASPTRGVAVIPKKPRAHLSTLLLL